MTHNIKDTIMIDTWDSCYNLSWKGIITAESFSHPAKFSHSLIRRIYRHIIAEGWVSQGDVILDPFGGVGLGGLYAAQNGLQWVGCELEQKFVDLGQQNIALWESKFAAGFPRWVTPILLQGDSRKLTSVIESVGCVVSSPPYAESLKPETEDQTRRKQERIAKSKSLYDGRNLEIPSAGKAALGGGYGTSNGQLSAMPPGSIEAIISSPPFAGNSGGRGEASRNGIDAALFDRHSGGMKKGTGESEGNLDHLPMGDVRAIISSPPYNEGLGHEVKKIREIDIKKGLLGLAQANYGSTEGQLGSMPSGNIQAIISSPPFADSVGSDDPDKRGGLYRDPKRRNDTNLSGTYGDSDGQLGAMKDGGIKAVISSPPFEDSEPTRDDNFRYNGKKLGSTGKHYGNSDNQLGNESGETFWQAAAAIVSQCAMVLPSGGHAVWVTKRYIKNGRIVDFTAQWVQLCEALGFKLLHRHKALLVKDNGSQSDMFGKDQENRTERKSFFRILHESKQKAAVHWETLDNSDRVTLLVLAYVEAFKSYQVRLAKSGKAPAITVKRVLSIAQMTGWKRDGKPYYDTGTAIDYEDILCMVKM